MSSLPPSKTGVSAVQLNDFESRLRLAYLRIRIEETNQVVDANNGLIDAIIKASGDLEKFDHLYDSLWELGGGKDAGEDEKDARAILKAEQKFAEFYDIKFSIDDDEPEPTSSAINTVEKAFYRKPWLDHVNKLKTRIEQLPSSINEITLAVKAHTPVETQQGVNGGAQNGGDQEQREKRVLESITNFNSIVSWAKEKFKPGKE